jgi:hypothetical protein
LVFRGGHYRNVDLSSVCIAGIVYVFDEMKSEVSQVMSASSKTPRAAILLPLAYVVHLAEEWFGGFLEWTPSILGYEIDVERFVIINAIALVMFTVGTLAAFRVPEAGWFAASLATLLGLNGILHVLGTVAFGVYSPGAITGLLLYVPVSVVVLRASGRTLPGSIFARAVLFGIVLHALVPVLAFI